METEGKKFDKGKPRVSLIPSACIREALEYSGGCARDPSIGKRDICRLLAGRCYAHGLAAACVLLGGGEFSVGLVEVAEVMEYGACKYGESNWRLVASERYVSAAWRHLAAYCTDPDSVDSESGLLHLAHLGANFAILSGL